jgi:predicted AlkP superfamily phosphohydrolase/phosphomutase
MAEPTTNARGVILIGVDGMDAEFVQERLHELPNLARLAQRGFGGGARSVFPSDSIPAWITIFTGIPPVEHGFLDAIDYFRKDHKDFGVDTSVFRGRTIWDVASAAGLRSCVINPFLAYPPWDIHGIMCSGPVFVDAAKPQVRPAELSEQLQLPSMGGIVEFPTKENLAEFCRQSREYTLAQHRFSLELLDRRGPWDFFFSTYLTLDRVQHFLWRYHDAADPTYPGQTPFQSVIEDFYRLFDTIVGDYLERAGDRMDVVLVADHGHGRRCTEVVNVNELLRRRGWLKTKAGGRNPLHPRRVLARAKTRTMELLDRYDRADLTYAIAKLIPKARALKKSGFLVQEGESVASVPYFAGTNPCGGVAVSRPAAQAVGLDYEALRDAVIAELRGLRHPKTGEEIFRWVLRREEFLGHGAAQERFPDVLFLMRGGFGVAWDLYGELVAVNPTHRKISGGHKVDGSFFASFDPGPAPWNGDGRYHLTDVAPIVLRRLGLAPSPWMQVAQRSAGAPT